MVTLGDRGSFALSRAFGEIWIPSFAVDVVDTTAAGDTYIGTFAARWDGVRSPEEALRWAAAASALCVSRRGAQDSIPTAEETAAALQGTRVMREWAAHVKSGPLEDMHLNLGLHSRNLRHETIQGGEQPHLNRDSIYNALERCERRIVRALRLLQAGFPTIRVLFVKRREVGEVFFVERKFCCKVFPIGGLSMV